MDNMLDFERQVEPGGNDCEPLSPVFGSPQTVGLGQANRTINERKAYNLVWMAVRRPSDGFDG
jgi:hypothetical protein